MTCMRCFFCLYFVATAPLVDARRLDLGKFRVIEANFAGSQAPEAEEADSAKTAASAEEHDKTENAEDGEEAATIEPADSAKTAASTEEHDKTENAEAGEEAAAIEPADSAKTAASSEEHDKTENAEAGKVKLASAALLEEEEQLRPEPVTQTPGQLGNGNPLGSDVTGFETVRVLGMPAADSEPASASHMVDEGLVKKLFASSQNEWNEVSSTMWLGDKLGTAKEALKHVEAVLRTFQEMLQRGPKAKDLIAQGFEGLTAVYAAMDDTRTALDARESALGAFQAATDNAELAAEASAAWNNFEEAKEKHQEATDRAVGVFRASKHYACNKITHLYYMIEVVREAGTLWQKELQEMDAASRARMLEANPLAAEDELGLVELSVGKARAVGVEEEAMIAEVFAALSAAKALMVETQTEFNAAQLTAVPGEAEHARVRASAHAPAIQKAMTDAQTVINNLEKLSVSPPEFSAATTVGLEALERAKLQWAHDVQRMEAESERAVAGADIVEATKVLNQYKREGAEAACNAKIARLREKANREQQEQDLEQKRIAKIARREKRMRGLMVFFAPVAEGLAAIAAVMRAGI